MMSQQQNAAQQESALQEQVAQLENIVKQRMSKEAIQRFGNVKIAHPKKAMQALAVMAQLIQQGRLGQIDDEKLKLIMVQLTPEKKEFKIKRI